MPVIDVGIRPGDHKGLKQIAERLGQPPREVAGILLEEAIRRESANRPPMPGSPDGPRAA